MSKNNRNNLVAALCCIIAFAIWTVVVRYVDVKPIGPDGSFVGLAGVNAYIHHITGVNMILYTITDWMGLIPVFTGFSFALLGLIQWIKRKCILKVDYGILILGLYYIIVLAIYLFFEEYIINYRPVLINGYLEASYPSSTTMLVLCVMPTAQMQFADRIKNRMVQRIVLVSTSAFSAFMVIGRLFSGVHWVSDILGGILLSSGLVLLYRFFYQQGYSRTHE